MKLNRKFILYYIQLNILASSVELCHNWKCHTTCYCAFQEISMLPTQKAIALSKVIPCFLLTLNRHLVMFGIVCSVISRLITMISAQAELEERANNQPIPEPALPVSSPPVQSYSSLIMIVVQMCRCVLFSQQPHSMMNKFTCVQFVMLTQDRRFIKQSCLGNIIERKYQIAKMNLVIYLSQDYRIKDSEFIFEWKFVLNHIAYSYSKIHIKKFTIFHTILQSLNCLECNLFYTLFRNLICSRYLRLIQRTLISYRDSQIEHKLNSEMLRKSSSRRNVIRIYREKSLMISQRDTSSLRLVTG